MTKKAVWQGLVLLLVVWNVSCDPGQDLILVNESNAELTVRFVEGGNSIHSLKYNIITDVANPTSDTTIIKLGVGNPHKSDTVHFGLGTWEVHGRMDSFLSNLKEVGFFYENDTVVVTDKAWLDSLFRSNMAGEYNQTVIIHVE